MFEPTQCEPVHREPVHDEPVHREPVHREPVHCEQVLQCMLHVRCMEIQTMYANVIQGVGFAHEPVTIRNIIKTVTNQQTN